MYDPGEEEDVDGKEDDDSKKKNCHLGLLQLIVESIPVPLSDVHGGISSEEKTTMTQEIVVPSSTSIYRYIPGRRVHVASSPLAQPFVCIARAPDDETDLPLERRWRERR